jgi:glutathione S-transferase
MKLYVHPASTACRPVMLFAAENKIAVDNEMIDILTGAHHREPYSTINPNRLVPLLEDGDFRLTESSAILKYLADTIGSPAYAKDLKARARVNEMMDWLNVNFYRDFGYGLVYPQLFPHHQRRSDDAQAGAVDWGKENAKKWLQVLNDHWIGPNKPYLCGDTITIADYFGAGIRWRTLGAEMPPQAARPCRRRAHCPCAHPACKVRGPSCRTPQWLVTKST